MRATVNNSLQLCFWGLTCAVLASKFARYSWRFELLTHWRFHYGVAALILLAIFALMRQYKLTGLCFLVACLNGVLIWDPTSVAIASAHSPNLTKGERFRLANTNVLFENESYELALSWLAHERPDVAVIVELTPEWQTAIESLKKRLPYTSIAAEPRGNGLGIYSRYPIEHSRAVYLGQQRRVAIVATLSISGKRVTLFAAHPLPPGSDGKTEDRDAYLRQLTSLIASADGPVILSGDLNTTQWSYAFDEVARPFGRTPSLAPATWPSMLGRFGITIDHILVKRLAIESVRIGPNIGSDHLPLIADLTLPRM